MKINGMLASLSLVLLTGCYQCMDSYDELCSGVRNDFAAKRAWYEWDECFEEEHDNCCNYLGCGFCCCDFQRGFIDGYKDVCEGRCGEPPLLPPRRYWCPKYQTVAGKQGTLAWFRGYSHGAIAADQDGVSGWGDITTARSGLPRPGFNTMSYPMASPVSVPPEPYSEPANDVGPPQAPPVDETPAYDPYEAPMNTPGPEANAAPISLPPGEFTLPLVPNDQVELQQYEQPAYPAQPGHPQTYQHQAYSQPMGYPHQPAYPQQMHQHPLYQDSAYPQQGMPMPMQAPPYYSR